MSRAHDGSFGLTVADCRLRQQRLRERLKSLGLDAALIIDARHVYYLSGYFTRRIFSPALWIEREGATVLAAPVPSADESAVDEVIVCDSQLLGTLVDNQLATSLAPFARYVNASRRIGCDVPIRFSQFGLRERTEPTDLAATLLELRRSKEADEVALLRRIIEATEVAYAYALENLQPGVTEVELCAGMLAAATADLGEVIGEFGNDFQIGAVGSAPRRRGANAGEAAILDLTVECRGYRSDMCRTLIVGPASPRQFTAHERILDVFTAVERLARPGVHCRDLYDQARGMLDGYEGWKFPHHLGHGIGLGQHESPRLNPHWDDVLKIGDVFTFEPGLYGPDLRAGIRVEQVYHLAASGLERLTVFPTGLDGKTVKV